MDSNSSLIELLLFSGSPFQCRLVLVIAHSEILMEFGNGYDQKDEQMEVMLISIVIFGKILTLIVK
jgi:hypothetical protein